jgi:hypothetical protein
MGAICDKVPPPFFPLINQLAQTPPPRDSHFTKNFPLFAPFVAHFFAFFWPFETNVLLYYITIILFLLTFKSSSNHAWYFP